MKDKISSIVQYTLPQFVNNEYQLFALFIKTYYEYMEETGNVLDFIERCKYNIDVDLADNDFIAEYLEEFADTFPKDIKVDGDTLIKYIREFYLAKGSENSFKFIFTMVHNADLETFYPREFLHESSNGNWVSEDYMYITGTNFDRLTINSEQLNAFIEGQSSGATGVLDAITVSYYENELVMKLDISSYQGQFLQDEDIKLTIDDYSVYEKTLTLVNTIDIVDGGVNYRYEDTISVDGDAKAKIKLLTKGAFNEYNIISGGVNYLVGDILYASPSVGDTGYGFSAEVKTIDGSGAITGIVINNSGYDYQFKTVVYFGNATGTGANIELNGNDIGKIKKIDVIDSGINYTSSPNVTITSVDGVGSILESVLAVIYNAPKYYKDQNDWLSNYDRMQDSYLYQKFSYIIKSEVSPHKWIEQIRRLAHPAGTQLFGMYALENSIDVSISLPDDVTRSLFVVIDLINDINNITITSANALSIEKILEQSNVCAIDLTDNDLDDIKFYQSFEYPIWTFKDYTIDQVIRHCRDTMSYHDDSIITIE